MRWLVILNIYTTVDLVARSLVRRRPFYIPALPSSPAPPSHCTQLTPASIYLYPCGGRARTQHGGGNGLDNCADVQVAGPGQLHPSTAPAMCHPVITNITLSYCHAVIQLALQCTVILSSRYITLIVVRDPVSCNNSDPFCSRFSPHLGDSIQDPGFASIIGLVENTRQPHPGEDNCLLKIMF